MPSSMTLLTEKQCALDATIARAEKVYPNLFREQLRHGLFQLLANTEPHFFESRSLEHLRKLLFVQFSLQKQMIRALSEPESQKKEVCIRVFSVSSRLCIALALSLDQQIELFGNRFIQETTRTLVPHWQEIPGSSLFWQSTKHSFLFYYVELQQPEKHVLSRSRLKELQTDLQKKILDKIHCCSSPVFWPYNYEESYRQLLLLHKEVHSNSDLPQISIHFRGHNSQDLEFLIYMVRPAAEQPFEKTIDKLPTWIRFISHISSSLKNSFFSEAIAFSLHIPISCLNFGLITNLLLVRKYVTTLLETLLGPFRDFNGGLFTQQEEIFALFKKNFGSKIPNFCSFAEVLFYSLKPIEAQLTLQKQQAESLFQAFSQIMQKKASFCFQHYPKEILIIKTRNLLFIDPIIQKIKNLKNIAYASVQLSDMHYLVFLDPCGLHAAELEKHLSRQNIRSTQRSSLLAENINLALSRA
jgi:hypothetical protein